MDIREVKIEEYWPLIVKGTEEFGQIAVAENPEFNLLAGHIYDVLKDSFIKEATEYGVSRWEKMLGLAVADGATLEDRKVAILTYLSVKIPYTWRVLKQMLTNLLGENNFEISLDNDTQTLSVKLAITVKQSQVSEVKSLLSRVVPYNLVIETQWANGLSMMDEYMPLEYVDIVKRFTHDSVITTNALDVELDAQFVYNGYEGAGSDLLGATSIDSVFGARRVNYFIPSYSTVGLRMVNDSNNREYFPAGGHTPGNAVVGRYDGKIPSYGKRKQVHIHDCGYDMDGKFYQFEPSAIVNNVNWGKMRFGSAPTNSKKNHWRIWRCTVRQNGVMTADFVPCVRVSDGSVGLWCNVYKKFYDQSLVATLDLDWELDEDNGVTYVDLEEVIENE